MRTLLFCLLVASCVASETEGDGPDDTFTSTDGKTDTAGIAEGSPEALAVLKLANDSSETKLRDDVGLSTNAAHNIATATHTFHTLAELDAVPYVGPIAFHKLLVFTGATSGTPHVGTGILLDCNISFGPDQQATVIGHDTTLTLRELTSSGGTVERPLAISEWTAKKLKLRDDFGPTTLSKENGTWVARSGDGGFSEVGDADCWVDKSH